MCDREKEEKCLQTFFLGQFSWTSTINSSSLELPVKSMIDVIAIVIYKYDDLAVVTIVKKMWEYEFE